MPQWYKCVVKATALTQEINTILYYGGPIPGIIAFDPSEMEELGEAVGAAQINTWRPMLPAALVWQSVDISVVDDDGVTVSPYIVTVPLDNFGALVDPVDTVALVAIAKFNCTSVSQSSPHSVPRRSYVCVGPLVASQIGQGGALTDITPWQTAATAAFTQGHLLTNGLFEPYRIGRTLEPTAADPDGSLAGVGKVAAVTVRPYCSYRRSRMIRPNGS